MSAVLLMMAVLSAGDAEATVDFDNQVIPILTKAGCNTGACHGAAVGRGGFKLSLYGSDPREDYRAIVLELEGRRVNFARPDESLIVLKPTESIEHGGGYRLEYDGEAANLLTQWIRDGTPRVRRASLQRFDVAPRSQVVPRVDDALQLQATAHFSNGSSVDVTRWTVFTAEDPAAVQIDAQTAIARMSRRGRHIVTARYLDRVVPLEIIVPLSTEKVDLASAPRRNFIDDEILRLLATLQIPVSPQAGDEAFLRRATLDLTGRLPAVEAITPFVDDSDPQKRAKLVDRLLESEPFNEYWTWQLAKLLRVRSQPQDQQGALAYYKWIRQQVAEALPYDEMARQLLMALGDSHQVGPANFYRSVGDARAQAEFASELFMGSRLRCANCHNHPLDRWTQDDYHGLAAIFAGLQRGRVIKLSSGGEVTHPRTGEAAVPRIPGQRFLAETDDGRQALATWLTDPDNPYFARAIVNRLWKAMMGRGLVEPSDDFRDTNPATHPALLERLADDFVQHGYHLRHTLRRIALSATYARASATLPENGEDDRFYSHALTRPLQAEVLADAISDVIGVADQYGDQPLGTRAVALFDSNISSPALDILGRCGRDASCESLPASSGGLPLKLHMFNGQLINGRIAQPQGRLARLVDGGQTAGEIVEQFYRLALGRYPTSPERAYWNRQVGKAARQQEALEDFVWSLLNCREFVTNH